MKNSLLSKANKSTMQRRWNANDPRIIDVSIAWVKGELRTSQVAQAIEKKTPTGSTYSLLATGLKLAFQAGRVRFFDDVNNPLDKKATYKIVKHKVPKLSKRFMINFKV